jgi:hypothetical protein
MRAEKLHVVAIPAKVAHVNLMVDSTEVSTRVQID